MAHLDDYPDASQAYGDDFDYAEEHHARSTGAKSPAKISLRIDARRVEYVVEQSPTVRDLCKGTTLTRRAGTLAIGYLEKEDEIVDAVSADFAFSNPASTHPSMRHLSAPMPSAPATAGKQDYIESVELELASSHVDLAELAHEALEFAVPNIEGCGNTRFLDRSPTIKVAMPASGMREGATHTQTPHSFQIHEDTVHFLNAYPEVTASTLGDGVKCYNEEVRDPTTGVTAVHKYVTLAAKHPVMLFYMEQQNASRRDGSKAPMLDIKPHGKGGLMRMPVALWQQQWEITHDSISNSVPAGSVKESDMRAHIKFRRGDHLLKKYANHPILDAEVVQNGAIKIKYRRLGSENPVTVTAD